MESRPKPKDISWPRFIAMIIILYAFLLLANLVFEAISAPALAYDQKTKGYPTSQK